MFVTQILLKQEVVFSVFSASKHQRLRLDIFLMLTLAAAAGRVLQDT